MTAFPLLATFLAAAHASDLKGPDFEITVTPRADATVVTATLPRGFHFNLDAPMDLEGVGVPKHIKPAEATSRRVEFRVPSRAAGPFAAALYICDDARTFCERHQVKSGPMLEAAPASPERRPSKKGRVHGFLLNDAQAALAQAAREKKPLLIDFFAIWCPPCNLLDEEVFPTSEFLRASEGFVRLKLDADSPEAWALKSRYEVKGYPTVILASSSGAELKRIEGFLPATGFVRVVHAAWEERDHPPAKPRAPLPEYVSQGDALETAAEAREKEGKAAEARELWRKAASWYRGRLARMPSARAEGERGYNLELAFCLWKSGDTGAADALYRRLRTCYPAEFTFHFGHARMLLDTKKLGEARDAAEKAYEFSYGDNRLRAGLLRARIAEAAGKPGEGLEIIHETLGSIPIPDDPALRTHRHMKELKELETRLASARKPQYGSAKGWKPEAK